MSDNELTAMLIDTYTNLQRILTSDNMKAEAEYQLQAARVKLKALGIPTSDLEKH